MKHKKLTVASISCGLSLLLGAGAASADPITITTSPGGATQTVLVGSDTLNEVMDSVLSTLRTAGSVTQLATYSGLGSSQGQRQMDGVTSTGDPACTPTDNSSTEELNPGCQEIAPMSRLMNSAICDDEKLSGTNTTAEHLAICDDGLVVITDNKAHAQFAETGTCAAGTPPGSSVLSPNEPVAPDVYYTASAAYANSGKLRTTTNGNVLPGTTYKIGEAGTVAGWKDVLRVIYTGCLNNQGTCEGASAVTRSNRCKAATNPVRQALIDHWDYIVNSGAVAGDTATDCNGATANACASGLRAAYRRDDSSGTTGVFLTFLSLGANLTQRTSIVDTTDALNPFVIPISETHMFCDGGDNEGWLPSSDGTLGDPITKVCAPEDDLCTGTNSNNPNNRRMGVVRAIRSPLATSTAGSNYPPYQCTAGLFARITWLNVALPVCPDGKKPRAGKCKLPYYLDTNNVKHFDCLNDLDSHPGTAATADGRAYNFVMRDDLTGAVNFRDNVGSAPTKNWPNAAQWRQNMRVIDTVSFPILGGPWPAGTQVCEQPDGTKQIGCLVANTTCTIGWAGREAAQTAPFDDLTEPMLINNKAPTDANIGDKSFPFARDLYMSFIGGAENITADCLARGGSAAFCADETAIANEFYNINTSTIAQNACKNAGFIPKPDALCVGAQASGSAGCGAPAVQAKTECKPNDPAAAP